MFKASLLDQRDLTDHRAINRVRCWHGIGA